MNNPAQLKRPTIAELEKMMSEGKHVELKSNGDVICGNDPLTALRDELALQQKMHSDAHDREMVLLRDNGGLESDLTALRAREQRLKAALERCFAHLGKEIERKTLNESARDGTQTLSRDVALLLDEKTP